MSGIYLVFAIALLLMCLSGHLCYRAVRLKLHGKTRLAAYYRSFTFGVSCVGAFLFSLLLTRMRIEFVVAVPAGCVVVAIFLCVVWRRSRRRHVWVSLIILAIVFLPPIALHEFKWRGVTDNMKAISAALGLPPPDPWERSPSLYYRPHFASKLTPGTSKEVAERDILVGAEVYYRSGSAGNEGVVYRYRIGTHGFEAGHDVFIYVTYSEGRIAEVGFDNS